MEHICRSDDCGQRIKRGEDTVQLLRGTCCMGYITPAFAQVMLEWHTQCFNEFNLTPQNILAAPYRCGECFGRIVDGDEVMCFVIGMETDLDHAVSESRGYEIYSVRHFVCQFNRNEP